MQPAMVVLVKEASRPKRRRRKWEKKSQQSCIPELAVLGETTTRTAMKHF